MDSAPGRSIAGVEPQRHGQPLAVLRDFIDDIGLQGGVSQRVLVSGYVKRRAQALDLSFRLRSQQAQARSPDGALLRSVRSTVSTLATLTGAALGGRGALSVFLPAQRGEDGHANAAHGRFLRHVERLGVAGVQPCFAELQARLLRYPVAAVDIRAG